MARALATCVLALLIGASSQWSPLLSAQESLCEATRNPWEYLEHCARSLLPGDTTSMREALAHAYETLHDPATLNSALGELEAITGTKKILGALHLGFVNLHHEKGTGLGLGYDWTRGLARTDHRQGITHWGFATALQSKGLLTVDGDANPENFLEASVQGNVYLASGGEADPAFLQAHLATLEDSIFKYETASALRASRSFNDFMGAVWDSLSTQVYLTAGPELRFESDQRFDHRQWAIGARLGLDIKAWQGSSTLAKLNVFDWPAAAIRFLTGSDPRISPRGGAIPTVTIGFHRVHLDAHPTRGAVVDLDAHNRFDIHAAYRSVLAEASNGTVWIVAEYRRHREPRAAAEVSDAALHDFTRFRVSVEGPTGLMVSWTTGALPTDFDDADHWGVGFRLRF